MLEAKKTQNIHQGRIFPEIQWSAEEKMQRQVEKETFRQRCQIIFEQIKPQLLTTHWNWYVAIEPNSGEYFLAQDELEVIQISRQKSPDAKVYIFRLNETGVSATI